MWPIDSESVYESWNRDARAAEVDRAKGAWDRIQEIALNPITSEVTPVMYTKHFARKKRGSKPPVPIPVGITSFAGILSAGCREWQDMAKLRRARMFGTSNVVSLMRRRLGDFRNALSKARTVTGASIENLRRDGMTRRDYGFNTVELH